MTDLSSDIRASVQQAHPTPTIGGSPGAHWLACACGFYITAKPSVRACRRSFKLHRINEYARAEAAARETTATPGPAVKVARHG